MCVVNNAMVATTGLQTINNIDRPYTNISMRTWCSSISPIEDLRGENNVLPFDDVASDSMMMKDFDALMESLEEAELEIIDPERWSVCTEYLSPYSFDNLLETSAGRSLPPQMRGLFWVRAQGEGRGEAAWGPLVNERSVRPQTF